MRAGLLVEEREVQDDEDVVVVLVELRAVVPGVHVLEVERVERRSSPPASRGRRVRGDSMWIQRSPAASMISGAATSAGRTESADAGGPRHRGRGSGRGRAMLGTATAIDPLPRPGTRTEGPWRARQPRGGTSSQPSRTARVASSVRDAMPPARRAEPGASRRSWQPIPSAAPISSLLRPSATRRTTSCSRARQADGAVPGPDRERQPARRRPVGWRRGARRAARS